MALKLSFLVVGGLIIVTGIMVASSSRAATNHIAQPWRAEAVVEGREVDYGSDWFLQEFSLDHIQDHPSVTENGLRATGGSITSNHLYYDLRLRQDFDFDDSFHAFMLDIQRSEDFDGAFDRQLVGLKYGFSENTEFWLQGDVFADKSLSDVYLTGRHRLLTDGYQHWLQVSLILPDTYFNDKTSGDDRLVDEPMTLFLQWQGNSQQALGQRHLASLSYTPSTSIDSRSEMLFADSESIRGAISWSMGKADWRAGFDMEAEFSERDYLLDENPGIKTDFERETFAITLYYHLLDVAWQPKAGLRYFSLDEQGYFGRRSDQTGRVKRREPLLFVSGSVELSPTQQLKPALYLGVARIDQSFSDPEWKDRDENEFIGKVSLPWQYLMSAKSGAVLTVALSANLHEAAFGGGNVQVHWPL